MLYLCHRLECFAWYIHTSPRAAYVPHCPCRLIARQYELKTSIYYIDCLGKFDYGPAHASRNHQYTYVCQQKRVNPMESMESSYKLLNSSFEIYALWSVQYFLYCHSGQCVYIVNIPEPVQYKIICTGFTLWSEVWKWYIFIYLFVNKSATQQFAA